MALSHRRRLGFTTSDLAFASQENSIEIVPLVKLPVTASNDGPQAPSFGPLYPPTKSLVPLWFALQLKKKRKCRIVLPRWLSVAALEETLREETTSDDFSGSLPRDYLELSTVLLQVAPDDFPPSTAPPARVKILLKDIREARQAKVRQGARALNGVHLAMPHLTPLEILTLRPVFSLAFRRLLALDPQQERHEYIAELWMTKEAEARRRAELGEFERERGGEGEGEGRDEERMEDY